MMSKNALKLVSANFYNFWKILLYKIIVAMIGIGLVAVVLPSVLESFSSVGFDTELETYITTVSLFPNITVALRAMLSLMTTFFNGFLALLSLDAFAFVYILIVLTIIVPMLGSMGDIAFGECIYGYMASLSRLSFTGSYVRKMRSSVVYSILKTLLNLVITAVIVAGGYVILKLLSVGSLLAYFVPIIFSVYVLLLTSLKQTLLCGWMPAMVVFNDGAVKGFSQGFRTVSRRFFKTLSSLIAINFIAMLLIYMFNAYILIVLAPLYALYILTFQMVMFFGSHGMRYYVDMDTILTPKKLETYDKMRKVKHLV